MLKGERAMQKTNVEIDQFQTEIMELLNEYGGEVLEALKYSIEEVAEESSKELKQSGDFKGRKFKSGWTFKQVKQMRFGYEYVVYNQKQPQLTHLLEFGHVKQNGGRTRAFNFIAPVNNKVGEEIAKKLERKLK